MVSSPPIPGEGWPQNRPVGPAMRVAYTGSQTEVDAVARALRDAGFDPTVEPRGEQVGAGDVWQIILLVGTTAAGQVLADGFEAAVKKAVNRVRHRRAAAAG